MSNKLSFENFILECCRAKEWDLRDALKSILTRNGFSIIEDEYQTSRVSRNTKMYENVHNMLAIRGNPKVCLVAHTDVCRDHSFSGGFPPDVKPIIDIAEVDGEIKEIITDEGQKYQVGGDDRLGVAINVWTALQNKNDVALLFTTDEEIGLISADYVKFAELLDFELLVQVDRGNHSGQLVDNISGVQLCSQETAEKLLQVSRDIELPRYLVHGFLTDVLSIKNNKMCKNAVNMTCGYHNSFGSNRTEYIDVQEAKDTAKYVSAIIDSYAEQTVHDDIIDKKDIALSTDELELMSKTYESIEEDIDIEQSLSLDNDLFDDDSYEKDKSDDQWDSWRKFNPYDD